MDGAEPSRPCPEPVPRGGRGTAQLRPPASRACEQAPAGGVLLAEVPSAFFSTEVLPLRRGEGRGGGKLAVPIYTFLCCESVTSADLIPHPNLKMIGFDYTDFDRPLLWGGVDCDFSVRARGSRWRPPPLPPGLELRRARPLLFSKGHRRGLWCVRERPRSSVDSLLCKPDGGCLLSLSV